VKGVPRVLGFIGGTSDGPAPISVKEAMRILNRLQYNGDKLKPKMLFVAVEVVLVTGGLVGDVDGCVVEVDYGHDRVKVSVLIFGRSTPVDLEFAQVEKA